jgi:hypothetical protein
MFLWKTAGFIKHSSRVAIAIVAGMAQKLKTVWFFNKTR